MSGQAAFKKMKRYRPWEIMRGVEELKFEDLALRMKIKELNSLDGQISRVGHPKGGAQL